MRTGVRRSVKTQCTASAQACYTRQHGNIGACALSMEGLGEQGSKERARGLMNPHDEDEREGYR